MFKLLWIYDKPVRALGFIFAIDYLMVRLLDLISGERATKYIWIAYEVGDSICLPLFAFFAAFSLRLASNFLYRKLWWQVSVFVVGIIVDVYVQVRSVMLGEITWEKQLVPGQLYHTIIFPFMFYWIGCVVISVWSTTEKKYALLSYLFLGLYFATYIYDIITPH